MWRALMLFLNNGCQAVSCKLKKVTKNAFLLISLSLCRTTWGPCRLRERDINALCINLSDLPKKFWQKILRIGRAGKWHFFEAAILNFLSRPFWIFFCFISVKNPALLYEVTFFSALWMVFPESWKRSCSNFYAHDCS